MNALAVFVVNEHINHLLTEAERERQARKARGTSRRLGAVRGFVASLTDSVRSSAPPATPRLSDWPYRP